ncbi:MAG: hypothetical protein EHM28_15065, partial [Spirochaetaceae bacterium]
MQIFRRENTALAAGVATALLAALILSIWTIAVLSVREKLEYETRMFDADIVFSHRDTPPLASFFRSGNDFDYLKPAAIPGMDKVTFYLKSHAQVKCVFPISVAKARLLEDNPERKFIAEIPVISFQDNPCKDSVPFARDFFLSSASSKCPSPINMNSAFIAPSAALFDLLSKSQGPGNMTTGSGILLDGLSVNGNFHIRKAV